MPEKYGLNGCMPAVVSSTEGSSTEGTSDADGTRQMAPLLEEGEEGLADLGRLHGSHGMGAGGVGGAPGSRPAGGYAAPVIVPWPITTSPSIRHAVWPGATP